MPTVYEYMRIRYVVPYTNTVIWAFNSDQAWRPLGFDLTVPPHGQKIVLF